MQVMWSKTEQRRKKGTSRVEWILFDFAEVFSICLSQNVLFHENGASWTRPIPALYINIFFLKNHFLLCFYISDSKFLKIVGKLCVKRNSQRLITPDKIQCHPQNQENVFVSLVLCLCIKGKNKNVLNVYHHWLDISNKFNVNHFNEKKMHVTCGT